MFLVLNTKQFKRRITLQAPQMHSKNIHLSKTKLSVFKGNHNHNKNSVLTTVASFKILFIRYHLSVGLWVVRLG